MTTGGTFGQSPGDSTGALTGGWGEAEIVSGELGDEAPSGDLGGGHFIRIDPEAWAALLHSPAVVDAITQRAQDVCDWANSNVAMDPRAVKRLGKGQPAYDTMVQNRTGTTRARARVKPASMLGVVDEAMNSTLLKAMNVYPSDPIPEGVGPTPDTPQTPDPSSDPIGTGVPGYQDVL